MALSKAGLNLYVLFAVFGFLGILCMGLRIYARRLKKKALAFNDYAAVLGLVFSLVLGASVCAAVGQFGLGAHNVDLKDPLEDLRNIFKSLFAFQITWAFANTFIKLSICHLYVTIFRLQRFRIITYIIMGLCVIYGTTVILETFLVCKPLAFNWDRTIRGGSCGNQTRAFEAVGILNLFTDVAVIILPMPWLWSLQLPTSKKIGLTAIFSIGIVCVPTFSLVIYQKGKLSLQSICAISVVRIVVLALWDFSDFSYGLGHVAYWSTLEPALGSINCCLPVLQPVISKVGSTRLGRKVSSSMSSSYSRSKKSNNAGAAQADGFQRMDNDMYPLTDTLNPKSPSLSETTKKRTGCEEQNRTIVVQHNWTIEHEDV